MTIQPCTTHLSWKEWEINHPNLSFLQSWEWGEFQRSVGYEPVRWQMFDHGTSIGQIQGFTHRVLPGVSYLYLPRMYSDGVDLTAVRDAAKNSGIDFLRIEPTGDIAIHGVRSRLVASRQPAQTLVLELSKTEEELLADMHTKTRYNIRVAQKHGVTIDMQKNSDIFWTLNRETIERDHFKSHEKDHYTKMIKLGMVYQFTAYYGDTALASIICVGFGNTFTYVHGASSNDMRNIMAPYAAQWAAIQFAKEHGYQFYDMWGIAPLVNEEISETVQCVHGRCWQTGHAWSGITRFKVGFGGEYIEYPQAIEVVCNRPVYWGLDMVKKIRRYRDKKNRE